MALSARVIAPFTLLVGEGFGSSGYSPDIVCFLPYDPARNCMNYLAHAEEIMPGWSLEGATEVGDDFAQQAQHMGWPPTQMTPTSRR